MTKSQKSSKEKTGWEAVPLPARCVGCPYPKVGITCYGADGTCTRTFLTCDEKYACAAARSARITIYFIEICTKKSIHSIKSENFTASNFFCTIREISSKMP